MKTERHHIILEILEKQQFVTVSGLADTLYVSLPTVRRDLAELERQGLIRRSHGGACVKGSGDDTPFDYRSGKVPRVKLNMSRAAAALIEDGDTVFIDGSTSCLHIADHLGELKSVTVVTNGVKLLSRLLRLDNVTVYSTGGELIKSSQSFAGVRAQLFITDFYFDKMFFSSSALDGQGNITDYSLPETQLRRAVFERTRKKIFLCDRSKHGISCGYFVANVRDIDIAVSDMSIGGIENISIGETK